MEKPTATERRRYAEFVRRIAAVKDPAQSLVSIADLTAYAEWDH